jgi:hypothetical protein
MCGSPGYTGRNIPCRPEFTGQPSASSCIYAVDPARMQEMLDARPGVCQRYGANQIICQNTAGQQCQLQTGTDQTTLQAGLKDDRVAWKTWCDEYKRLLRVMVMDPLDAEFSGNYMTLRANMLFGFYNPKFNDPKVLKQRANASPGSRGGTVWASPGMIVFIAKPSPGFAVADRTRFDQATYTNFQQRVKTLASEMVQQLPDFPQPSRISYFGRSLEIKLNDPGVDPSDTGPHFRDCEKALDEVERDRSTQKR